MGITFGQKISENSLYHMVYIIWSISHGEFNMAHIIWNFALKQWVFELVFAFITKIRIQIFTNFYDFFDLLCFRRYSDEGWKSVWSRVPEIIPLPRLMDRDFLYIYSSLKVKNLYKFLIGSTTYWKIQYFFVWHCLPVCWSVGCAVRYIGVRRVYWSWFLNIHEHNAPYL